MQEKPPVGLYLDTRTESKKHPGKYHIKVRITFQIKSKKGDVWEAKYILTKRYCTHQEFTQIESGKAKGALRDIQDDVFKVRAKVETILNQHPYITIDHFFELYDSNTSHTTNIKTKFNSVKSLYAEVIATQTVRGTIINYEDSLKSILAFGGEDLSLNDIDEKWLESYEHYMMTEKFSVHNSPNKKTRTRSLNTVGFYLRPLRAVFNYAIDVKKTFSRDNYPFGKNKYTIRKKKVLKKALPNETLQGLIHYKPTDNEQKYLDYWLFSYFCNGMNFTDIAYLKIENFRSDSFYFIRKKTENTVQEQEEVVIPFTEHILAIMQRRAIYSPYVFGIITEEMDDVTRKKKINQWIHLTNKWMRKIAKKVGYRGKLSSYSARHSFTTELLEAGVPITKVSKALAHKTITTTVNYAEDLDIKTSQSFGKILSEGRKKE